MDGAIGNVMIVPHGLIVTVVEAGRVVAAVEELEGVVIKKVGLCSGKTEMNSVEVIEELTLR